MEAENLKKLEMFRQMMKCLREICEKHKEKILQEKLIPRTNISDLLDDIPLIDETSEDSCPPSEKHDEKENSFKSSMSNIFQSRAPLASSETLLTPKKLKRCPDQL